MLVVATTGEDVAPGTADKPFRTISRAAEVAMPGDTILVRAGVYRELVTPPRAGEPGKPITYRGENSDRFSSVARKNGNRHGSGTRAQSTSRFPMKRSVTTMSISTAPIRSGLSWPPHLTIATVNTRRSASAAAMRISSIPAGK